ncbi:hypothetical protein C8J57DRAFT_1378379 [Mycena rebaudengoi]|nr:hypothetical protein C8J57DRAFT_1378379 [Mycena rebaudengoi]
MTWMTRALSHRDTESLGMWAASLKLMAGTQDLLPTVPLLAPPIRRRPRYHPHPPVHVSNSRPLAPPASPLGQTPGGISLAAEQPARGVLHEASAACNKIMQLATSLERRTNAERRLSRKRPNREAKAVVGRPAPASTPPDVRPPPHPPRPPPLDSLNLVGLLSCSPASPLLPPSPATQHIDVGTDVSMPTFADAAANTPTRTYVETAVNAPDPNDHNTSYGVIPDPFARGLARLLPLELERERRLPYVIYLGDAATKAHLLSQLPPTQRVYLSALAEIFRPWNPPDDNVSLRPLLNPAYNLFIHWYTGWNAIPLPGLPPERDLRFRYQYLEDAEIRRETPFSGRGYVVEPQCTFIQRGLV